MRVRILPLHYPSGHEKAGSEVTRSAICKAIRRGETCNTRFTQTAVSMTGHWPKDATEQAGVEWTPPLCNTCTRHLNRREANR